MADKAGLPLRERVWITIVDHEQEPPRPVEEIFIENGRIQERKSLTQKGDDGSSGK